MLQEADLHRIERGSYTADDVREMAAEIRRQRGLNSLLLVETNYLSGVLRRSSVALYLEAMRALSALRNQHDDTRQRRQSSESALQLP